MLSERCSHVLGKHLRIETRTSRYPLTCSFHTCSMSVAFCPSASSCRSFPSASRGIRNTVGYSMPWWVACFETIIFVNIFLDAGGPRSRCKVRSHCGHSKNDYICGCSYSLSQAQSVHSVWSSFFLDGLESTSWGPIPQFRRMVEGRVLILRLNFSFSVQNFIELYNRNVKSSRKHDRSQWTRCNGGIPHVPQRYTKKRDAEKCNLKPSAHWIFNLVDSCWPGFPLCVVHNGGSGGVSVWKESTRASFDGIRQCGAMLPRPAVPGHERQNAPHNGIICRINF